MLLFILLIVNLCILLPASSHPYLIHETKIETPLNYGTTSLSPRASRLLVETTHDRTHSIPSIYDQTLILLFGTSSASNPSSHLIIAILSTDQTLSDVTLRQNLPTSHLPGATPPIAIRHSVTIGRAIQSATSNGRRVNYVFVRYPNGSHGLAHYVANLVVERLAGIESQGFGQVPPPGLFGPVDVLSYPRPRIWAREDGSLMHFLCDFLAIQGEGGERPRVEMSVKQVDLVPNEDEVIETEVHLKR